jgi:hypothetical protein
METLCPFFIGFLEKRHGTVADSRLSGSRTAGLAGFSRGKYLPAMRVMFWTWITLIAAGLVFYSVIGLGHH